MFQQIDSFNKYLSSLDKQTKISPKQFNQESFLTSNITGKLILVIDDDEGIQAVTKLSLETLAEWEVLTAFDVTEGLLKATSQKLDAILLDLVMPDVDGFDALQQLRANPLTQSIPVILFTAKILTEEIWQYYKTKVLGFVNKPFDALTLASQIAEILDWQFL
jgi:CheY-like chemotaxis protein